MFQFESDLLQEMFAYGVGSVLSSFFSGYITAASVARSALQEGAGGKTQVSTLYAFYKRTLIKCKR